MKSRRIKDIEKYSNKWVALDSSGSRVIVSGKNFKRVYDQGKKKNKNAVLMKVPRLDASFAGRCR